MEISSKIGIIPARYASTRFPGKPLAMIGGITMIERVYSQCRLSTLDKVVVATDDTRIEKAVLDFGGEVIMTSDQISTGTERCREALLLSGFKPDRVVNIQGDEPFVDPKQINTILELLSRKEVQIATLVSPALDAEEIGDPNRVKAVVAEDGRALYFSRLPIPYSPTKQHPSIYRIHLGMYGFTAATLKSIGKLKPGKAEKLESLEQLRWLEKGYQIHTALTLQRSMSVDTPEDLVKIEKAYFFDGH